MKLAASGSRGVFWRVNARGTQERRLGEGRREQGDWWIRWACPFGHLHRAQIGPKALAQRESERRRIERQCPQRMPKPTAYLLADVIHDYLAEAKSYKRSYRDDKRYGEAWSGRFAGRTLAEVTPGEIERIKVERLCCVKAATVNREVGFLKHVFNIAIRDGKTDRNPVSKVRILKEPSGRARYLSDDEETRLVAVLATDSERDRIRFLIHTGLRKSEFANLRWKDVDLKAGVITIPRSKNGETRHVLMTSVVRALLGRMPRPIDPSMLVFPSSDGTPHTHWAEKAFPEAIRAARIHDFRFHDLRHTFASRLAMEGVDLLTIKELGGVEDSVNGPAVFSSITESPTSRNRAVGYAEG